MARGNREKCKIEQENRSRERARKRVAVFNRSTTVPEAPRVGCAMDGIATDVYYL